MKKTTIAAFAASLLALTACTSTEETQPTAPVETQTPTPTPTTEATAAPVEETTPDQDEERLNASSCHLFIRATERLFSIENPTDQEILDGFHDIASKIEPPHIGTDDELNALMTAAHDSYILWETSLLSDGSNLLSSDDFTDDLTAIVEYCDATYGVKLS